MQDIRLRTVTAFLLSLSAFISLYGAVVTFLWWLICSGQVSRTARTRMLIPVAAMVAFFSVVLSLTGGDGLSYFIRMIVIVLIGFWIYAEHRPGEFLQLGVWMLGDRAGFEFGMLADMGMQTLHLLIRDFDQVRVAESLKGTRTGWKMLVPVSTVLVNGALIRAESTAELMAVRGYRHGGTFCPAFSTTKGDLLSGFAALCVLIIALIPVSEFFILYR